VRLGGVSEEGIMTCKEMREAIEVIQKHITDVRGKANSETFICFLDDAQERLRLAADALCSLKF